MITINNIRADVLLVKDIHHRRLPDYIYSIKLFVSRDNSKIIRLYVYKKEDRYYWEEEYNLIKEISLYE